MVAVVIVVVEGEAVVVVDNSPVTSRDADDTNKLTHYLKSILCQNEHFWPTKLRTIPLPLTSNETISTQHEKMEKLNVRSCI